MATRLLRHSIFAFACLSSCPFWAGAQPVSIDPRYAEFAASADHDTVVSGQPVLTGYTLEFYLAGADQPFQSVPLGKLAPGANDLIRIDLKVTLIAFPPPGVVYESRVTAIGPGGDATSTVSNQFQFSATCALTLSTSGTTVGAGASTGTFGVSAGSSCTWTAVSTQSWLTVTPTSGIGSQTLSFSVTSNPTTTTRTGVITVGTRTFTVTQSGTAAPTAPVGIHIIR